MFDDIVAPAYMPINYAGFDWGDEKWGVESDDDYTTYGNSYGAPSPSNAAYNANGVSVSLTRGSAFDFDGAYFTGWGNPNGTEVFNSSTITVEGYLDGSLVGSVTMNLATDKYDWLAANFKNVNELRFLNDGQDGHWWLMDDFTYGSSPVPEPATIIVWSLLGGLCLSIGWWRRRRAA